MNKLIWTAGTFTLLSSIGLAVLVHQSLSPRPKQSRAPRGEVAAEPGRVVAPVEQPRIQPRAPRVERAPTPAPSAPTGESARPDSEALADMWSLRPQALDAPAGPGQRIEGDAWSSFEMQPVDPSWAPQAKGRISQSLTDFAPAEGFTVLGVECRQDSCVATLGFDDPLLAYQGMARVAARDFSMPCTVSITDDNPSAPEDRSSVRVYFTGCQKRS